MIFNILFVNEELKTNMKIATSLVKTRNVPRPIIQIPDSRFIALRRGPSCIFQQSSWLAQFRKKAFSNPLTICVAKWAKNFTDGIDERWLRQEIATRDDKYIEGMTKVWQISFWSIDKNELINSIVKLSEVVYYPRMRRVRKSFKRIKNENPIRR